MIPNSLHIYSGTKKDEREMVWETMRDGKQGMIVITTNKIASKGLNIPPLKKIINAGCDGNDQAAIQTLGRVLRLFKDKHCGEYIDFIDHGKYTNKWSRIRLKALKNEGHNIITKTVNEGG